METSKIEKDQERSLLWRIASGIFGTVLCTSAWMCFLLLMGEMTRLREGVPEASLEMFVLWGAAMAGLFALGSWLMAELGIFGYCAALCSFFLAILICVTWSYGLEGAMYAIVGIVCTAVAAVPFCVILRAFGVR